MTGLYVVPVNRHLAPDDVQIGSRRGSPTGRAASAPGDRGRCGGVECWLGHGEWASAVVALWRHAVAVLMNTDETLDNDKFRMALTEDLLAGAKLAA